MKAIIINAQERKVYDVETPGTLKDLQDVVGGLIELVRLSDDADMYVNEEGLLLDPKHFFIYEDFAQPLAGNAIIVGHNDEGETIGTTLKAEDIRPLVKFVGVDELHFQTGGF